MNTAKKVKSPFPLRIPEALMELVRQSSASNERSANAEIAYQLKKAYGLKQIDQEAA